MGTVSLGKIAFTWRGSYDASATYARQDVVGHHGDSFVCLTDATTGVAPHANSPAWDLFAQGTQGVPAPEPAASATSASQTPAPRYTASNLERAFNFMDANHDGQVSREEAAGFRGVARHFDQADTNHDGFLSRDEFDAAMNYVKPQ